MGTSIKKPAPLVATTRLLLHFCISELALWRPDRYRSMGEPTRLHETLSPWSRERTTTTSRAHRVSQDTVFRAHAEVPVGVAGAERRGYRPPAGAHRRSSPRLATVGVALVRSLVPFVTCAASAIPSDHLKPASGVAMTSERSRLTLQLILLFHHEILLVAPVTERRTCSRFPSYASC